METGIFSSAKQAFVWIWLPGRSVPMLAGKIEKKSNRHFFSYDKAYLEQAGAISLSPFELPLEVRSFEPSGLHTIHSCLRDASPDAWGRRVIATEYQSLMMDELDYMLLSGSNRIGALDFQRSATEYVPRLSNVAQLAELLQAAEYIEKGMELPKVLGQALLFGTSIGGARPKCLIENENKHFIAKFSLSTDLYDIIKAEYIAMKLAKKIGLVVPDVFLKSVLGKNVLLVERFDRVANSGNTTRKLMLSCLSLLELNELEARYASYVDFAEIIRHKFKDSKKELEELYKRIVFNILIGNTDDHARNHAAFWDGLALSLTPVYDLCPQPRAGQEATQAMSISGKQGNMSSLVNILSVCEKFFLSKGTARELIEDQIKIIENFWMPLCDEIDLPVIERKKLWGKSIFNPFCFYDF